MSPPLAIGIDAGGSKVEGLLVDPARDGAILDRRRARTPATDPEATVRTIIEVAGELAGDRADVAAVGVGAAGLVDLQGVMVFAPNLAWRGIPLAARVSEGVGLPAVADNDANVAAWGEYRFGAGRDAGEMFLVTVGTGVGGGIVAGGRLLRGAHGFAGEVGHIVVDPGGPVCGCGNRGCWEQMASGRAIDRLGAQAAAENPRSHLAQLIVGEPGRSIGPLVTEAARAGDPVAVRVLADAGRWLGVGIAGLVNVFDPDVVVVGGGAVAAGDLLLDPARRAVEEYVEAAEARPPVPIVPATMGNDAGAVGAADLALRAAAAGSGA